MFLIKKESKSLIFTGLKIPRDYRDEKMNLENFIEISNKGKKYYVPRTCYYPLLKEDAVNECRWENDPVYEAMKEMYEALQCYF